MIAGTLRAPRTYARDCMLTLLQEPTLLVKSYSTHSAKHRALNGTWSCSAGTPQGEDRGSELRYIVLLVRASSLSCAPAGLLKSLHRL